MRPRFYAGKDIAAMRSTDMTETASMRPRFYAGKDGFRYFSVDFSDD